MSIRPRVRAPELRGRGWLNTGGRELSLADFRGRFLVLDFWTFCCVNCLHVLEEMRPLEAKYADELVVVGVHSPKFAHEADPDALAAAVERYSVHHPVLDDPDLVTWQAYTARAWPTLVLVDPEGYVVAQYAGEGHAHAIDAMIASLREEHLARGTLQPGNSPYVPPAHEPTDLRFPAKAVLLPDGDLLVADAGHDELVVLRAGSDEVVRRISGFREPSGLCLLPPEVAAEVEYDVVVANTAGHRLDGLHLATGDVRSLAGDGGQWMQGDGTSRLSSPWDVAWWQDRVWIAMAGIHQLWTFDPRNGDVSVVAGTTNEGLLDGPLDEAWFAQPSGLAADGERLWVADAETSALRVVSEVEEVVVEEGAQAPVSKPALAPVSKPLAVTTVVGTGLFDFGFRDGPAEEAMFQHPLGVTVLPDGSVAVCDTYNGAVRRFDPATGTVTTLAGDLAEPSGAVVDGEHLVVVESAAHRLTRLRLGELAEQRTDGFAQTTQRPVTSVAADLELTITFEPPPGQKVDDRFGPSSQLLVTATPPSLIKEGEGRGTELTRRLTLDPAVADGVLHIAARAASCDSEAGEGAACHVHQQDWGVPVRVEASGDVQLELPLGGA